MKNFIDYSLEVKKAIKNKSPLVALESTIISHGMPYPINFKMAQAVEALIRKEGATPATIAIIDGRIKIGLNEKELLFLAKARDVIKTSKRDIPYVLAQNKHGGTTVAGTIAIAELAKIPVFVTGGIGGVHRDVSETFDISADLIALSKTNMAVICAGAKSILDLPKTLEFLDTHGVLVIGYKTSKLPAFYTPDSGLNVDYQLNNPDEIASLLKTKWALGLAGGVLIANPIPKKYALSLDFINNSITKAIKDAKQLSITGKAVTPFLLAKLEKLTKGDSLDSNLALVKNNAILGAKIACALTCKKTKS